MFVYYKVAETSPIICVYIYIWVITPNKYPCKWLAEVSYNPTYRRPTGKGPPCNCTFWGDNPTGSKCMGPGGVWGSKHLFSFNIILYDLDYSIYGSTWNSSLFKVFISMYVFGPKVKSDNDIGRQGFCRLLQTHFCLGTADFPPKMSNVSMGRKDPDLNDSTARIWCGNVPRHHDSHRPHVESAGSSTQSRHLAHLVAGKWIKRWPHVALPDIPGRIVMKRKVVIQMLRATLVTKALSNRSSGSRRKTYLAKWPWNKVETLLFSY